MVVRQAFNLIKGPLVAVGKAYNATAQKYPMYTGVVTTVAKTSAADLFAQKVVERRDEVDWRRHSMFVMFGFGYLGCWQYYLYNDLFVRWCRPITNLVGHYGAAPVKVFIDQCIHHPLLYFPAFYSLKGMVEGKPMSESISDYREHLWENCKALWTIWVPAQLVNFSIVPLHLRIPFVAGVSFAWTVVISVMRGAMDKPHKEAEEEKGPSMIEQAAAAAASATGSLARSSPILGLTTANADCPPEAVHEPVGLQQLVAAERGDASGPIMLR